MSDSIKKTTLIFAVIMGFIMALYSTSRAEIDAGPEIAAVSAADASAIEVPNDESGVDEAAEAEATAEVDAIQANPAREDATGTAKDIYDALKAGKWLLAFGGIIMFLVWGLRLGLGLWVSWFKTRKGGYVLGLGTSVALGVGTAILAGGDLGIALFLGIVATEWAASGAWVRFKDVFIND